MYATPWCIAYWLTLIAPAVGLLARLGRSGDWIAPARGPGAALLLLWLALGVSAFASPVRGPVLLWSAPWWSALTALTWAVAWRAAPATKDPSLATAHVVARAGVIFAITSLGVWLAEIQPGVAAAGWRVALTELRNAQPLGHANYTAGGALLALPALAHLTARSAGWRRWGWLGGTGLVLAALFSSGSRGGFLGLGVVLLAGLGLAPWPPRWKVAGAAAALAAVLTLAAANPRVRSLWLASAGDTPPNASSVQRRAMLAVGWTMGRDRPWVGWGLHATPLIYPRYRASADGGAENVLQLHNTPLEIWTGTGFLGVIAVGSLAWAILKGWRRVRWASVTVVGYGAFALTDYQLDVPWMLVGLVLPSALLIDIQPVRHRSPRWLAALLLVGTALLISSLGEPPPAPRLNTRALALGADPAHADEAIALLQTSLTTDGDQEIAHFNLGWLQVVRAPAAAAAHFRAAAGLVPDKGGVYFGLGLAALNQGQRSRAATLLALECLNDPAFLFSPWWNVPALAALRDEARRALAAQLDELEAKKGMGRPWLDSQLGALRSAAPALGTVDAATAVTYRRQRLGYPVLMRDLDLPKPVDLFDVRESSPPRGLAKPLPPLPSKGWLPSTWMLDLLARVEDDALSA